MKKVILFILLALLYTVPAEALTTVDTDKTGNVIFRKPETVSEVLNALRVEGYPANILGRITIHEVPEEKYYDPEVKEKISGRCIKKDINGIKRYDVYFAAKNKDWIGVLLHELGHVLEQEQEWRIPYFLDNLTDEEIAKIEQYARENSSDSGFVKTWKYTDVEMFAESFAKRYEKFYKSKTCIVSPYNPAVDLRTEEPIKILSN